MDKGKVSKKKIIKRLVIIIIIIIILVLIISNLKGRNITGKGFYDIKECGVCDDGLACTSDSCGRGGECDFIDICSNGETCQGNGECGVYPICGDGLCWGNKGENCLNCLTDCPCPLGELCNNNKGDPQCVKVVIT